MLAQHGTAIYILDHGCQCLATISTERVHVANVLQFMRPVSESLVCHLEQLVQHPPVHGLLQPNAAWASTMKTSALYLQQSSCLSTHANGVHGCWCQPITLVCYRGAYWSLIVWPRTNVKREVPVQHELNHVVICPGTLLQCMMLKCHAWRCFETSSWGQKADPKLGPSTCAPTVGAHLGGPRFRAILWPQKPVTMPHRVAR